MKTLRTLTAALCAGLLLALSAPAIITPGQVPVPAADRQAVDRAAGDR